MPVPDTVKNDRIYILKYDMLFYQILAFMLYVAKVLQMSGMAKQKREFLLCASLMPPPLHGGNADESNRRARNHFLSDNLRPLGCRYQHSCPVR